jgi:hypothetical protein
MGAPPLCVGGAPFAGANGALATNVHLAHLFLLRKTASLILWAP